MHNPEQLQWLNTNSDYDDGKAGIAAFGIEPNIITLWAEQVELFFPPEVGGGGVGVTTQNMAHIVNDLDPPIHTGTQLEKSSPSP